MLATPLSWQVAQRVGVVRVWQLGKLVLDALSLLLLFTFSIGSGTFSSVLQEGVQTCAEMVYIISKY